MWTLLWPWHFLPGPFVLNDPIYGLWGFAVTTPSFTSVDTSLLWTLFVWPSGVHITEILLYVKCLGVWNANTRIAFLITDAFMIFSWKSLLSIATLWTFWRYTLIWFHISHYRSGPTAFYPFVVISTLKNQHGHMHYKVPFLSPPVCMHGGLLCIAFCLDVT